MSAVKKRALKSVKNPQTIGQAVEAVKTSRNALNDSEHAHLLKVYKDADDAQQALNQALANLNMAIGARHSFVGYIIAEYAITGKDELDVPSGRITREAKE